MADRCNKLVGRAQCSGTAKWAPKLHVPMRGVSIDGEAPVTAILGLKLCDSHIDAVAVSDFPKLEESLSEMMKGMPLDISRAWFSKIALDSAEFRAWEK